MKEQEKKLQKKKQQNKERQVYQVRVREIMYKNQQDNVNNLLNKRNEKEEIQKKSE